MKQKIYLETSVISYLTARLSSNLVIASQQQVTQRWWEQYRDYYELYVSEVVVEEASRGDHEMSTRRLNILEGVKELEVTAEALLLAQSLIQGPIPQKAANDALHIAVTAQNGIDYLLTWNCRHISNPLLRRDIIEVCRMAGCDCPVICSPLEFFEG